ncbi:hypothetical protein C0J52_26309 [Blattella germanica]|nr:hypothetical protein C0J52_26309 [Blattella germanica]
MVMVDKDSSKEGWPTPNCHCPRGCSELSYTTTMTYGSVEPGFADTLNYLPRKYNHSQG